MTIAVMDVLIGLIVALIVGLSVVSSLKSLVSDTGLHKIKQRLGNIYTNGAFVSAAAPTLAMWLVASLRAAPTSMDAVVIVLLMGVGIIAAFTVLGNILKLIDR